MLPKRERIAEKSRIKGLLARKRFIYSSPLLKIVAEENNRPCSRWIVICSKKLGNAVVRNRERRIVNAAIYNIRRKISKNMDIAILPRGNQRVNDYEQILFKAVAGFNCNA